MKDYTFKVKRDKKKSTLNVTISGQLNIGNMNDIHKELLKVSTDFKNVNVDIDNVEDADLTLMQLLRSYKNYCDRNNIELLCDLKINDDIKSLFERAGLLTLIN